MVKRVDNAVFSIIDDLVNERFSGGIRSFGLAENGVGYVYDEHNRDILAEAVRNRIEELRQSIIRGDERIDVRGTTNNQ